MKLLLDNGLPRSAAALLNQSEHQSVHVGDIGLATASDDFLLQYARDNAFVVVTLDADFHTLLALSDATRPSVIRIRIEKLKGPALCDIIERVVARFSDELDAGAALSVTAHRVSCHLLPLR